MELTTNEINKVNATLANAGYDELDDYFYDVTTMTTDNYKALGGWKDIKRDYVDGADLIEGYQTEKGEPREDLLIVKLDGKTVAIH